MVVSVCLASEEFLPQAGIPVTQIVIFLHGYGSCAADLMAMKEEVIKVLGEGTAILAPNAPFSLFPLVEASDSFCWFPLEEISDEALEKGARQAHAFLKVYIEKQVKRFQVDCEHVALVGFSQGCMMALYTGLRLDKALGAIVGWSGKMISSSILPLSEFALKTRVQLWHGDQDDVVPPSCLEESCRILQDYGIDVSSYMMPCVSHGVTPLQIQHSFAFIQKCFDDNL